MQRHNIQKIERLKNKLDKLKAEEANIKNKYSDNFKQWQTLCNKINRYRNKYNNMVREFNFDNGLLCIRFNKHVTIKYRRILK